MRLIPACLRLALLLTLLKPLHAVTPPTCPAGAPLGRFDLTVSAPEGKPPHPLQSINRLLPGYKISYRPSQIDGADKKKARISLLLVPSGSGKISVTEPKPADEPIDWNVPFRTQIASLVWGPAGLDRAKVSHLVTKNDELIGQLADYATRIQDTQNLLAAISQQNIDPTQNMSAAVAGFASAYPNAPKLDRNAPADAQLLTLINGVNPALAAYDPLGTNPQQRAAQTAGLAASVAGLFFGSTVGLAAGGGAILVNMHSLLFPNTEFRSALIEPSPDPPHTLGLCGNKVPSASRTELAFLWAARLPDMPAPEMVVPKREHLPIGIKSTVAIEVKGLKDPKLAARAEDWKLVSSDRNLSVPIPAKVAPDAKSVELDLTSSELKTGAWKLVANWDWDPVPLKSELELHNFSSFSYAHLTPESQDKLTPGAGKDIVNLTGSDFQFVQKLFYKKLGDPFAQPVTLPFRLPDRKDGQTDIGPAQQLQTELDTQQLRPGDYAFLIAQADGKQHEIPFKVLPADPALSSLPLIVHTGAGPQVVELHGTNLDRIEKVWSTSPGIAAISLEPATNKLTITLAPDAAAGQRGTLLLSVKDVSTPVTLADAIQIAGPRAAISNVRKSMPGDLGIAVQPDEIPAGVYVSFAISTANASSLSGISLSCAGRSPLKLAAGESSDNGRLRNESTDSLFLSFNPERAGPPGCAIEATLLTAEGPSDPYRLGTVVRLPKLEAFQLTDEKSGDSNYIATLQGRDLETIEKVGWDPRSGVPVDAIPAPVAGEPNKERLRVAVPWPAPSPHAPLYIWLRGEITGRLTSTKL